MQELVEQLKRQIIEILSLEEITPNKIDPAAPLFGEGLGLDSIDALELVVMLEQHYDIRITDLPRIRAGVCTREFIPCPPRAGGGLAVTRGNQPRILRVGSYA